MGARLYWEPVKRTRKCIGTGAPSSFMERLEKVFGSRNPTLGEKDIPKLEVLRDVSGGGEGWQTLIDAIEHVGDIQIGAEY